MLYNQLCKNYCVHVYELMYMGYDYCHVTTIICVCADCHVQVQCTFVLLLVTPHMYMYMYRLAETVLGTASYGG